jgi:hypothetical protein
VKKTVTVIAVQRAEEALKRACQIFEIEQQVTIRPIMLVDNKVTNTPAYKGDETGGYFREIRCDFTNIDALKSTILACAKGQIIFHCRMEEAIKDYAKVVSLFPSNYCQTPDALDKTTHKYKMRTAFEAIYPEISPKFIEITNKNDISINSINELTFPVIIKPNGLHSSFFVKKCISVQEVMESVSEIFEKLNFVYQREYGTGLPSLIVEEFIEGDMYSIDAYVTSEKNYTFLPPIRVITAAELGLDGYYSYRHIIPTDLSGSDIEQANLCAARAMESVGLSYSSAHIELYKTNLGWKIIELGPRIGGYRQELYYEAYGIEHYYNDLLVHYGKVPEVSPKWNKYAAGFNIYADKEGIIKQIIGLNEAKKLKSVIKIDLNCSVGSKSEFASNGGQFLVDGILCNSDARDLENDMNRVRELILIDVE